MSDRPPLISVSSPGRRDRQSLSPRLRRLSTASAPPDLEHGVRYVIEAPKNSGVGSGVFTDGSYFPGAFTLEKYGMTMRDKRGHRHSWGGGSLSGPQPASTPQPWVPCQWD